ncbi:MAG: short-chain dehydrogenase [Acidimicrobiaceae bacterium]|nr:short-chain dehydrogenase [Acidimicrobiaceae bacterium]
MSRFAEKVVLVTGASAGIGRATAEELGRLGAKVALVARGSAGLDGAVRAIEAAGGTARAYPTDVADFGALREAAQRAEAELGPIEGWINDAFTSVFAPFKQVSPEDFARVTEVSYLGFVHGTMIALSLMEPRGRGTIVQVGSALSERSIPLQSAYCGAKHAVNGFTESLRCELLHDKSPVQITVVQMPAVNTPQFSWVRTRLPNRPQPVPPIYQPELAARGVVWALEHPSRKQYWVGGSTVATLLAQRLAPAILDRYLARTGYKAQQTDAPEPPDRPDNLYDPVDGPGSKDHGAHGSFDDRSHARSLELWCSQHRRALGMGLTGVAAAAGAAALVQRD